MYTYAGVKGTASWSTSFLNDSEEISDLSRDFKL